MDTTGVDVQCNLNVEVVKLIDLCILFVYFNEMVTIHDQFVFLIICFCVEVGLFCHYYYYYNIFLRYYYLLVFH